MIYRNALVFRITVISFLFCSPLLSQDGIIRTYYSKGKIESQLSFVNDVYDGTSLWFYKNGNLKEEKTFSDGILNGWIKYYYESGIPKEEYYVKNGILDGSYNLYYENGGLKESRFYNNGVLIRRNLVSYDATYMMPVSLINGGRNLEQLVKNVDEFLCEIEICAEPIGGIETILDKIIYPEDAKLYGLEGTVLLLAKVNEQGLVESTRILKGIGLGCDEEAQRVVKDSRFFPGQDKGIILTSEVSIKIPFKLQGAKKLSLSLKNDNSSETSMIDSISLEQSNDRDSLKNIGKKETYFIICEVDECPEPVGGMVKLLENVVIPPTAKRLGIQGEVIVRAEIDEMGFVINTEVIKGIGFGCDEAAEIAVLKTAFIPGKNFGVNVKSNANIVVPVASK